MDNDELFATIATERRAVADLLVNLTPEQLAIQSLCGDWDVKTVGGHLSFAMHPNRREFFGQVLRQRLSFDRANDVIARRYSDRPLEAIVGRMRTYADSRFHPPGPKGKCAPLTDIFIHGGDIRLPLGLPHEPPPQWVRISLNFLRTQPFGFVKRGSLAGLRWVADDADFSYGEGPVVSGRAIDIAMAMTGRAVVLDSLEGDGVAVLRTRLA